MAESLIEKLSEELVVLVARITPAVVALAGKGSAGEATGSGWIMDEAGHVVTNHHVVEGLDAPLDATVHRGPTQKAELVGIDPLTDLAVLKLTDAPGPFLTLREAPARLGELCFGLGSPFGIYPESVAMGVVSGVARTIPRETGRPIDAAIQTDAAINPGNSGGPLVDASGLVIGVNQCVDTRAENIGFAIPAQTVRWVAAELIGFGQVTRAALGVSVLKKSVEVNGLTRDALAVTQVASPRDHGDNLEVDDVILSIGTEITDETGDLYRILTKELIDQPTPVEVLRKDAVVTLTVYPTQLGGPPKESGPSRKEAHSWGAGPKRPSWSTH